MKKFETNIPKNISPWKEFRPNGFEYAAGRDNYGEKTDYKTLGNKAPNDVKEAVDYVNNALASIY